MTVLKRVLLVLLALLVLLVIVVGGASTVAASRLSKAPSITTKPVTVPTDAASIARGEHLAIAVSGCNGCHGPQFGGTPFINEPPIGYIPAPNLTSGTGGIGASYSDEQWERAIRHGVAADGRPLIAMPSNEYSEMSDGDVAALIAYLKQVAPVDSDLGARRIAFPGTLILGFMAQPTWPVNTIDHAAVGTNDPTPGPTADYGDYLSHIGGCRDCHGANLAGGTNPETPIGPNLTPSGPAGSWSESDFITALRTGQTPSGTLLSEAMPWETHYQFMTDDELKALYAYLQTLESLPTNAVSSR